MVLTVITCVAIGDAQAAAGAVVINPTVYTPGLLKVNCGFGLVKEPFVIV